MKSVLHQLRALCGAQQEPRSAQLTLSVPVMTRGAVVALTTDDESMAADHVTDHIVVVIRSVSMHGTNSPLAM
jgi:hypothetical protein